MAKDGFDAGLDYPEPPSAPAGKTLTGYFEHSDWSILGPKYDRDIKAVTTGETRWNYTVYSTDQGSVTLNWELINVPVNLSLELYDPIADKRIDMQAASQYTFNYQGIRTFEIITSIKSGVASENAIPTEFKLFQNYPNPFNPTTTIKYTVPKESHVWIDIYDLNGRVVERLVDRKMTPGEYYVNWDAGNFGSGVYLYKIQAGTFSETRKCVLVK